MHAPGSKQAGCGSCGSKHGTSQPGALQSLHISRGGSPGELSESAVGDQTLSARPPDRRVAPPDLRPACASLLLYQGIDLNVVEEIVGRSTSVITANLCAHVQQGLKDQAATRMDALFSESSAVPLTEPVPLAKTG